MKQSSTDTGPNPARCKQGGGRTARMRTLAMVSAVAALSAIGAWKVSAHDMPEFLPPLLSFLVGDEGTTSLFWRPGVDVGRTDKEQLVEAQILVPASFKEVIERTFDAPDYEEMTGEKLVRIVIVTAGSARASDCHWHRDRYHCHSS